MNAKELKLIVDILDHSAEEILSRADDGIIDLDTEEKQYFSNSLRIHNLECTDMDNIPDAFMMEYFSDILLIEEFILVSYKLLIKILNLAYTKLSRYGCNDITESIWDNWTIEERRVLVQQYHRFNGDINEYDPDHLRLYSTMILFVMYKKYVEEYEYRKPIFKKALTWYKDNLNMDEVEKLWVILDNIELYT